MGLRTVVHDNITLALPARDVPHTTTLQAPHRHQSLGKKTAVHGKVACFVLVYAVRRCVYICGLLTSLSR